MSNFLAIFQNKQFQNIAFSHFNMTLGTCLLIPILSVYLKNCSFTETQIGIIMGATAVSALLIRPWVGYQVDSKGSRPVILVGQLLLLVSTMGCWWATSFFTFIGLRLLFGVGQAFYGTGAVTFASSIGAGEKNSNSIAMYTLITMFALGISMSIAQVIFDNFGFNLLVGASAIGIGVSFVVMKFRSKPIKLSASNEVRTPFMEVLKSNVVLATTLSQFAASFSFCALLTFIPLAAIDKGIGFYSLFFIAFSVTVIFSRIFVQRVRYIFGLVNAGVYSSLIMLVGIVPLFISISPLVLIVSGILFGLGFGIIYPILVMLVVEGMEQKNRGTALGVMIAAGDIGNALSSAVLGAVAEHFGYVVLFSITALLVAVCTYYFYHILVKTPQTVE